MALVDIGVFAANRICGLWNLGKKLTDRATSGSPLSELDDLSCIDAVAWLAWGSLILLC